MHRMHDFMCLTILTLGLTIPAPYQPIFTLYGTILALSHQQVKMEKEKQEKLTCPQVVTPLGKDDN